MAKILNGVDPVGKIVKIITRPSKAAKEQTHTYVVTHVSGLDNKLPSESEKIVYLRIVGPNEGTPQPYISIPLSTFVEDTVEAKEFYPKIRPLTKIDVFWEFPVVDKDSLGHK